MRRACLSALLLLAVTGCTSSLPDVPGLGPRPIEKRPILPPDPAREPDAPATPTLAAQLGRILADARAGDAAFRKQQVGLSAAIARGRGAAEGSEAWIAGQEALSALDAARGPVRDAAAAIDALRVEPAYAGAADRAAIDAAAVEVANLAEAEAKAAD